MEILDEPLIETTRTQEVYAGFWKRLGASLLDSIFLAPLTIVLTFTNATAWKSPMLLIGVTLLSMSYKPFMEIMYGATWGKMIVKIKVVNVNHEKATAGEILMRNIFHIVPTLLTLFFTVGIYSDPDFQSVTEFTEYSAFTSRFVALQIVSSLSGLVTIVDGIVMMADQKSRALHDMIGQTFVVVRE
jgi:uncharacterized RDD family membrane protein YckC